MRLPALIELFGGKCCYCGRRVVHRGSGHPLQNLDATKDHDTPKCRMVYATVAARLAVSTSNEVLACWKCNTEKGDMTGPEFISFRKTKKFPATYIDFLEVRLVKRLGL